MKKLFWIFIASPVLFSARIWAQETVKDTVFLIPFADTVLLDEVVVKAQKTILNTLAKWEVCDYSRFKGMGPAKSITVMAALELGKRRKLQNIRERLRITCSKDIYEIFQPLMCDLAQEEFWVLLLNQATKLIDKIRISSGGIDGTYADVRSILREALMQRATQIAVVHNHPSGNIQPSQPDRTLTEHIRKAADTMNIRLIDHVIVCEDGFYSFADEGLL